MGVHCIPTLFNSVARKFSGKIAKFGKTPKDLHLILAAQKTCIKALPKVKNIYMYQLTKDLG
jgi:hypothetical protein